MLQTRHDTDWTPVQVLGEERNTRWLVLCDHATNTVPTWLNGGSLGLSEEQMQRHIAFDPGALGVAVRLAEHLAAPAVIADFSRLVVDPNRGLDDPTLVRRLYDGTIIPGNRRMTGDDIQQRIDACYLPYHQTVARLANRRTDTVMVTVHSFTPRLINHEMRPWHIGILYAQDQRLSLPLIDLLRAEGDLVVGENEPYPGELPGDTIDQHAIPAGLQNTLLEIRNDLISTEEGQAQWANRLARLLPQALELAES